MEETYTKLFNATAKELEPLPGGEVAAAMRLDDDSIVTGISIPARVDSAQLCAETGPICEAHKRGCKVTHTLAVEKVDGEAKLLEGACGICQERLAVWGLDVLLAVEGGEFKALRQLRPHYWDK